MIETTAWYKHHWNRVRFQLIVSANLWGDVSPAAGCRFYRTEKGCDATDSFKFYILVPLKTPVDQASAPSGTLNPFIFATPGYHHGVAQYGGRGLEIHLKNKRVSARFNSQYWGMEDDSSSYPATSFVSQSGLPWALELPALWHHPIEKMDLVEAYPGFVDFVQSSGNEQDPAYRTTTGSWYLSPASDQKVIFNF